MQKTVLDHIGNTPMVALTKIARDLPVPVLVKCEHLNPGGSVKDRIALAIVDDAERRGVLRPGDTLIEATAGNTGLGLALVAAIRGYKVVCVLPEKMSIDKQNAVRAVGAEVIVTPNAPATDENNFQNVARRLASDRGWFLTDQFSNPANVDVHERTTGSSQPPDILDRSLIDDVEHVRDEESFAMVRRLVCEEGLFVGGSAGTNVVAAVRLAARGGLSGPVATVLPDAWDRYRAKP